VLMGGGIYLAITSCLLLLTGCLLPPKPLRQ